MMDPSDNSRPASASNGQSESYRELNTGGQIFGPPSLRSPSSTPGGQQQQHDVDAGLSPDMQPARKRKRFEESVNVNEGLGGGAGFMSAAGGGNYADSNPDLDSYIKSKRKPREKKACQVCRKRKVACDQQQPCLNCIERRYPELCVYENTTDTLSLIHI